MKVLESFLVLVSFDKRMVLKFQSCFIQKTRVSAIDKSSKKNYYKVHKGTLGGARWKPNIFFMNLEERCIT